MASTPNNNSKEKDKAVNVNNAHTNTTDIMSSIRERVNKLLTVNKALSIYNKYKDKRADNVNVNTLKNEIKQKYNIDLDNDLEREYLETLYKETFVIGIRVPLILKPKYKAIKNSQLAWTLFKSTFIELIEAFSEYKPLLERYHAAQKKIEIKLNPNIIINNVKAEAKSEVNIDVSGILAELEEIKKLVYNWYRMGAIPKAAFDNVNTRLKKIEKLMRGVN